MRVDSFAAALFLTGLVACGGGGGGSATGPSPTPTSLSISPATEFLKLRAGENFTATAASSSGSTTVAATWRSDNQSVVTIDSTGRATAVSSGAATIIAEYQGLSASRLLRVVPDYAGNWRGHARLLVCDDTGDWETACDDMGVGELDTFTLIATQQNAAINGTLDIGGMAGSVTGTIATDGTLAVTGTYTIPVQGLLMEIAVSDWQTISTDNSRMTGRMTLTVKTQLLQGQLRLQAELVDVNKSASFRATSEPAPGALAKMLSRAAKRRT
jgi:hypothetical protein